jgi:hypothetical protein
MYLLFKRYVLPVIQQLVNIQMKNVKTINQCFKNLQLTVTIFVDESHTYINYTIKYRKLLLINGL